MFIFLTIYPSIHLSSLSLSLPLSLSHYLSSSLSMYPCLCQCLGISASTSILVLSLPLSLSLPPSLPLSISLPIYLYVCLQLYLSLSLSLSPSPSLSLCISSSVCLSIHPSAKNKYVRLPSKVEVNRFKKRRISPRRPQKMEEHSCKTTKFCETSSKNWVWQHQKWDFLQSWRPLILPMRCANLPSHLSQVLRLPRRREARSYEVLWSAAPVTQNHLGKPNDLMPQNASLRKPAPYLPNMSKWYVSCPAPAMHLCRSSSNPSLPKFLKLLRSLHVWLTFDKVQNP